MTKEELKKEFEKYLKDSSDYYDPREPLTERKLLQMWLDCAEPREKRIKELEKENAELKRDKEDLIFIRNQNAKCMCEDKERLTKAKEIIKDLMVFAEMDDREYEKEYKKAEQFLKEE